MPDETSYRRLEAPLAALSAALGESLVFDSTGQIVLLFDGDVEVVVAAVNEFVTIRSALLTLTPSRAAAALFVNYGRLPPGLAVALDRGQNLLTLFWSTDAADADPDRLVAVVAQVVALVPELRRLLAAEDTPAAMPDLTDFPPSAILV